MTPSLPRRRPMWPPKAAAPSPVAANAKAAEPEAPKKKRGFWARVFGGGGRDDRR